MSELVELRSEREKYGAQQYIQNYVPPFAAEFKYKPAACGSDGERSGRGDGGYKILHFASPLRST